LPAIHVECEPQMNTSLQFRKGIVCFLGTGDAGLLNGSEERDWETHLRWLDRSGLALPLAASIEATQRSAPVPEAIKDALRMRLLDNGKRMEEIFRQFAAVQRALAAANVQYCCVKGFSLVPDCFDAIRERHQVDLDFLVAREYSGQAQRAIETLGYRVRSASDSGEVRLIKPWKQHLGINAYLYQMPEAPPIELHSRVWEPGDECIDFSSLTGFLDACEMHEVSGVQFPRLRAPYQFVYLLLHIFRHLLGSWIRLLSLYEIAIFVRARADEPGLWAEVNHIIGGDARLASACALVLGLVNEAFPIEWPPILNHLYKRNLSSESALWIKDYSTAWLFTDPPGNKLSLLLQQQFSSDHNAWRRYRRRRLLPLRKPHALSDEAVKTVKATWAYRMEAVRYKAGRAWYHVHSDCTYLAALLKWKRVRRSATRAGQHALDEL
jgi:hypothetical protein